EPRALPATPAAPARSIGAPAAPVRRRRGPHGKGDGARVSRADTERSPRHSERGGGAGVSERISKCVERGTGHSFRILRSFRSLTPTRRALRRTGVEEERGLCARAP